MGLTLQSPLSRFNVGLIFINTSNSAGDGDTQLDRAVTAAKQQSVVHRDGDAVSTNIRLHAGPPKKVLSVCAPVGEQSLFLLENYFLHVSSQLCSDYTNSLQINNDLDFYSSLLWNNYRELLV